MKKTLLVAICYLIFTGFLASQEEDNPKKFTYPNSYFTFDPINTFIDVPLPRINVGYFTPVSKSDRWRIGTSIGVGSKNVSIYDIQDDYNLWEIRPQLIYHLKRDTRIKAFFSLELFYIHHTETRRNSTFRPEGDFPVIDVGPGMSTHVGFDQADYQRIKYGFTINYGDYIRFSDRIGLRSSAGIGMRIKDNQYTNVVNPRSDDFDSLVRPYYLNEGVSVGVEVQISFRLYFTTRKKDKS